MNSDQTELDFLFTSKVDQLLQQLVKEENSGKTLLQLTKQLRKQYSRDQASQILSQLELRKRAAPKFSKAAQMFFTRQQLEQATSESIAIYKARRFHGMNRVADLCCGIGGDAIGLADGRELTVVDRDPHATAFAERNVAAYGFNCKPVAMDVMDIDISNYTAFHIDPDRRVKGNRSTRSEFFCPDEEDLDRLANINPSFAMKLAPATKLSFANCEREFIGFDRECKQQIVWSGNLKTENGVRATTVDRDSNTIDSFFVEQVSDSATEIESTASAGLLGRYLYDPHSCLIAARLVNAFARQNGLHRLSHETVYLTGDVTITNSLVQCFEVLDQCSLDEATIKKLLAKFDVGQLEVKKRGIEIELMDRILRIKCNGTKPATLIMAPTRDGLRGFICKRNG